MSICLSCSVSFRFFLLSTSVALEQICNCGYYVCLVVERGEWGVGERNLTHCWPHDKRWLVNKSKAKANVSSLVHAVCPAVPLARYRMSESFCLQLATAFGWASVLGYFWPSGMQHDWLLHSAQRRSTAQDTRISYAL